MAAHGGEQRRFHGVGRDAEVAVGVGVRGRDVIRSYAMAFRSDRERRGSRQGVDADKAGGGLGHVSEAEEVVAGLAVESGAEAVEREDRLDFAGEYPLAVVQRVEQRLHPEAVPREQQPTPPAIVDREGEDPAEPVHQRLAFFFVQVDQHLRVRRAAERVAALGELTTQLAVVVDLAVEHHLYTAVLVRHRLPTGG